MIALLCFVAVLAATRAQTVFNPTVISKLDVCASWKTSKTYNCGDVASTCCTNYCKSLSNDDVTYTGGSYGTGLRVTSSCTKSACVCAKKIDIIIAPIDPCRNVACLAVQCRPLDNVPQVLYKKGATLPDGSIAGCCGKCGPDCDTECAGQHKSAAACAKFNSAATFYPAPADGCCGKCVAPITIDPCALRKCPATVDSKTCIAAGNKWHAAGVSATGERICCPSCEVVDPCANVKCLQRTEAECTKAGLPFVAVNKPKNCCAHCGEPEEPVDDPCANLRCASLDAIGRRDCLLKGGKVWSSAEGCCSSCVLPEVPACSNVICPAIYIDQKQCEASGNTYLGVGSTDENGKTVCCARCERPCANVRCLLSALSCKERGLIAQYPNNACCPTCVKPPIVITPIDPCLSALCLAPPSADACAKKGGSLKKSGCCTQCVVDDPCATAVCRDVDEASCAKQGGEVVSYGCCKRCKLPPPPTGDCDSVLCLAVREKDCVAEGGLYSKEGCCPVCKPAEVNPCARVRCEAIDQRKCAADGGYVAKGDCCLECRKRPVVVNPCSTVDCPETPSAEQCAAKGGKYRAAISFAVPSLFGLTTRCCASCEPATEPCECSDERVTERTCAALGLRFVAAGTVIDGERTCCDTCRKPIAVPISPCSLVRCISAPFTDAQVKRCEAAGGRYVARNGVDVCCDSCRFPEPEPEDERNMCDYVRCAEFTAEGVRKCKAAGGTFVAGADKVTDEQSRGDCCDRCDLPRDPCERVDCKRPADGDEKRCVAAGNLWVSENVCCPYCKQLVREEPCARALCPQLSADARRQCEDDPNTRFVAADWSRNQCCDRCVRVNVDPCARVTCPPTDKAVCALAGIFAPALRSVDKCCPTCFDRCAAVKCAEAKCADDETLVEANEKSCCDVCVRKPRLLREELVKALVPCDVDVKTRCGAKCLCDRDGNRQCVARQCDFKLVQETVRIKIALRPRPAADSESENENESESESADKPSKAELRAELAAKIAGIGLRNGFLDEFDVEIKEETEGADGEAEVVVEVKRERKVKESESGDEQSDDADDGELSDEEIVKAFEESDFVGSASVLDEELSGSDDLSTVDEQSASVSDQAAAASSLVASTAALVIAAVVATA